MFRPFATLLALAAALAVNACVPHASAPVIAAQQPDPAVSLANEKAGGAGIYREGYIGEGDDRIHFVEAGAGPVVLFVHGFPAMWYVWFDQMEALRGCRRVIAIDAPGANLSAKPASTDFYRIENLADRLDEVIAQLAPGQRITLVGHDWGGALAWSYAERDSSRIERLAVFSAPPHDLIIDMLASDPEQRSRSAYMERFSTLTLEDIREKAIHASMFEIGYRKMIERGVLDEKEGEVFRRAISDPVAVNAGMDWYRANIPAFASIDPATDAWPARGAATHVPTLLVRGSEDRTFVTAMGERARSHAHDLTIETIEGVGHWTPFEDPQAANRVLRNFLGVPGGCLRQP